MLANVIDRRTNPHCVHCDVAFEPSCHDNSVKGASRFSWVETDAHESCVMMEQTTVAAAAAAANERRWPVTLCLYDAGTIWGNGKAAY